MPIHAPYSQWHAIETKHGWGSFAEAPFLVLVGAIAIAGYDCDFSETDT